MPVSDIDAVRVSPFLCVGVTGHRRVAEDAATGIEDCVAQVLDALAAATCRAAGTGDAGGHAKLATLSQLAAGADQLVARLGEERGYAVRGLLPFACAEFEVDFPPAELAAFRALLARADWCWTLPGERANADAAYALAGEATVAQCNLLLAVWDGEVARGPGGTADVVDYAVRRGVPVVHVPADGASPPRLLWSGLLALPSALLGARTVPSAPADAATLGWVVSTLLGAPEAEQERRHLRDFQAEAEPRWRWRLEYPLLLALTGARGLRASDLRGPGYAPSPSDADAAWPVYAQADALADHYANLYRGGGVFNFAASAGAVLLALAGLIWPAAKLWLVLGELILIAGLVANTALGTRRQWHRRWLDYRLLAERLRLMRSLKRLGVATPRPDLASVAREVRWIDPIVTALWQHMGPPPPAPDVAAFRAHARQVAADEVRDQVAYHRNNARRMHRVEHRLHRAGSLLFQATLAIGLATLWAVIVHRGWLYERVEVLAVLAAALPTVGAAAFGLRSQGDFAAAAGRSAKTAARLASAADNLERPDITPSEAARSLEDAAATMLDDLGEWQAAYRYRKLAIPA